MSEQATGAENQEQQKTFTQEDVNRIVQERLNRAKADVPANLEELKAKAAKFDEFEEANKSELEKAQAALAQATERIKAMEGEQAKAAARAKVSQATGIPQNLITGDDEESMTRSAEAISAWMESQKPSYPADKGTPGGVPALSTGEINQIKDPAARIAARAARIAQSR